MPLTFGSLFAGIGGMDLGLERAGMKCLWQVEIDEYCQQVLRKHWPDVPRWGDVQTFEPSEWEKPDIIAGGFPCQDISTANPNRTGITGARSGLWGEFRRLLQSFRPRYAIIENAANLVVLGLDQVLCDLASMGFDAEWATLSAYSVGAPHRRERAFIIAYPVRERRQIILRGDAGICGQANAWGEWEAGSSNTRCSVLQEVEQSLGQCSVYRRNDGIPRRMDRLRGLGNAVVPQVAELLGRMIIDAENLPA